jgi:hypothetical protein
MIFHLHDFSILLDGSWIPIALQIHSILHAVAQTPFSSPALVLLHPQRLWVPFPKHSSLLVTWTSNPSGCWNCQKWPVSVTSGPTLHCWDKTFQNSQFSFFLRDQYAPDGGSPITLSPEWGYNKVHPAAELWVSHILLVKLVVLGHWHFVVVYYSSIAWLILTDTQSPTGFRDTASAWDSNSNPLTQYWRTFDPNLSFLTARPARV